MILSIGGQITGQAVDLLRALLKQETMAPVLDLKDLLLLDREAVRLLAFREPNGVELRNCRVLYARMDHEGEGNTKTSERGIDGTRISRCFM